MDHTSWNLQAFSVWSCTPLLRSTAGSAYPCPHHHWLDGWTPDQVPVHWSASSLSLGLYHSSEYQALSVCFLSDSMILNLTFTFFEMRGLQLFVAHA